MESVTIPYFIVKGEYLMEILVGVVVAVAVLFGLSRLVGDDGRSYEEYRRAEYRNEYLWEQKQRRDDNYFLDAMAFRRP